jgi:hypothetical protein
MSGLAMGHWPLFLSVHSQARSDAVKRAYDRLGYSAGQSADLGDDLQIRQLPIACVIMRIALRELCTIKKRFTVCDLGVAALRSRGDTNGKFIAHGSRPWILSGLALCADNLNAARNPYTGMRFSAFPVGQSAAMTQGYAVAHPERVRR